MSSNKVVLSDKKVVNQDFDNLFSRIANIQNSIKTISNNDASKAVNDFGLPVINADILASALQDTDVLFNASKILEELCPDINIDEVTKSIELTDTDDKDQDKE